MGYRELFTESEWATLQFAPFWAFIQIAGSDGHIDEKETASFNKELLTDAPIYKSPLVREVFLSIGPIFTQVLNAFRADSRKVFDGLQDTARVLTKVDADQANMFKFAIMGIGKEVATASGAMFGEKISEKEKEAWALCAVALGFDMKASQEALAKV
jgi:hypothetical protein